MIPNRAARSTSPTIAAVATLPWPAAIAIVALVALNTLIAILRLGQNVPVGDDWFLVDDIQRWYDGTLDASFLLRQHNEHRLFFPRLYMLLIVQLSAWDLRHLMLSSLVAAGFMYALFCRAMVRNRSHEAVEAVGPACAAVGTFVFSIGQFQNWLWGWQIQVLMNIFAVTAGFYLLSGRTRSASTLIAAGAAGVVATFSFANGVLFWPLSLAFFTWRSRTSHLIAWCSLIVACLALYLWDYQKPAQHPGLLFGFSHPLQFAAYLLTFLGGPLVYLNAATKLVSGVVGVGLAVYLGQRLLACRDSVRDPEVQFWLACGGYAFASGVITAWGRVGIGAMQAAESRYLTIANLFWVMLVGLAAWLMRRDLLRPGRTMRALVMSIAACVAITTIISTVSLHRNWPVATLVRAADELRKESSEDAVVRTVSRDVSLAQRGRRFLNAHGLSYAAR